MPSTFHKFREKRHLELALFSLSLAALLFTFTHEAISQQLPDKIRGYKVHKANIEVKNKERAQDLVDGSSENDALIRVGEPEIVDLSVSGITFSIGAELSSLDQSGTVDFLTFHDFRVNGLKVVVKEYDSPFDFRKGESLLLPRPVEIFLGTGQAISGAVKEIKDSKDSWRVTGRVFVFGRFKKSIFKFKRVVPVDIDILIKNPLKELQAK